MNGLSAFKRQNRTTGAGGMIAQSVADIVGRHEKLSVEGIDRMYVNIYVPRLQTEQGVVWFFREHRGQPPPSAALMSPMSRSFVAKLESFVAEHQISLVSFRKGQRKDAVMAEHLRKFGKEEECSLSARPRKRRQCSAPRSAGARPPGGPIRGSCARP
jgi:hypothetical protein